MVWPFTGHIDSSQAVKLPLNARNNGLERLFVAIRPCLKQLREFLSLGHEHSVLRGYFSGHSEGLRKQKNAWPVCPTFDAFLNAHPALEVGIVQLFGLKLLGLCIVASSGFQEKPVDHQQPALNMSVCNQTGRSQCSVPAAEKTPKLQKIVAALRVL